ncbi:MAG: UvrD-helicase domain-containing protein, partial [Proteobacteria bacterium]|nr:UvrD-helicase domain-containing protein [Pseudomonadota bacterium]
ELSRLSSARGLTDYVEIGISAGDALGDADQPGDVALLLDYQVRHILVDEMQDTSKAQYRMLEALTGGWQKGDGRTLFCVGDPMQSIYRFRNAEIFRQVATSSLWNCTGACGTGPRLYHGGVQLRPHRRRSRRCLLGQYLCSRSTAFV